MQRAHSARRPYVSRRLAIDLARALAGRRAGLVRALEPYRIWLAPGQVWAFRAMLGDLRRVTPARVPDHWLTSGALAWDAESALVATLGEAVERYAPCVFGTWQTPEWSDYGAVRDRAIPVEQFALPSERERLSHRQIAPVDDRHERHWTRVDDLAAGGWRLAPTQLVNPVYLLPDGSGILAPTSTTGMAAGFGREAALLNAFCEVIERDAFMITHLNRLPLPEIRLASIRDEPLATLIAMLRSRPDVTVRAWHMTLDIRVPTVLAACTVRLDENSVFLISAATRPDPVVAVEKAVMELLQAADWLLNPDLRMPREEPPTLELTSVRSRAEHVALGTYPQFVETLHWLLATPRETVSISDLASMVIDGDVGEQLDAVLHRLHAAGLTAYAVDFTPPEARDLPRADSGASLQVWRALVPASQPLTFGPVRCVGGERVYGAPVRAGYRQHPMSEDELNPLPHCFP